MSRFESQSKRQAIPFSFVESGTIRGALTAIVLSFGGLGCEEVAREQEEERRIASYEDPDARFDKGISHVCPQVEGDNCECPFQDEPDDKVVFSGPLVTPTGKDLYDPAQFNYDLFYDTLRLVDSVPAGEKLYATTFYFSVAAWGTAMRDALLCAAARGVEVYLLIGNPIEPNSLGILEEDAGTLETYDVLLGQSRALPNLHVFRCTGACIQDDGLFDGKQHSKFIAASKVCNGEETASAVVAISSNNWTSSLVKRDNATLIKRNDLKLYSAFTRYFNAMVEAEYEGEHMLNYYDATDEDGNPLGSDFADDLNYSYHLFPRKGGSDPVHEILSSVKCEEGAEIRVSMSRWTTARDELADTLGLLAFNGCRVQIIVGNEPNELPLREYLLGLSMDLASDNFQLRQLPSPYFHDKYFLIDSKMANLGAREKLVWTGSHNFSHSSLKTNEEASLSIKNGDLNADGAPDNLIYEYFLDHFDQQWERGALEADFN